ncbi:MAG: T9SS type A sorting domain-containing protein [Bacteroidota bacterium]
MWSYITANVGSTCAQEVPTNNLPPVVSVPNDFAIPVGTPFVLVGAATDETPGSLTYVWEEVNLGAAGPPPGRSGFSGNPPLFRSFDPTTAPVRFFPQRDRYIGGLPPVVGEALPTNGGALRFRLTVRDNNPGAGAVGDAETLLTAYAGVGPFAITAPNEANQAFEPGSEITVAWDVAGTASLDADGNPDVDAVDEDTIDIFFSRDNGVTFTTLVLGTPNDGVETVRLPFVETVEARLLIRAGAGPRGSAFFDVNDVPFRMQIGVASGERPETVADVRGPWPNPVGRAGAWLDVTVDTPQAVEVALYDALGRRVRTLFDGPLAGGLAQPVRIEAAGLAPGAYVVRVTGETAAATRSLTVVR